MARSRSRSRSRTKRSRTRSRAPSNRRRYTRSTRKSRKSTKSKTPSNGWDYTKGSHRGWSQALNGIASQQLQRNWRGQDFGHYDKSTTVACTVHGTAGACGLDPNCAWSSLGCRAKPRVQSDGLRYSGPMGNTDKSYTPTASTGAYTPPMSGGRRRRRRH